MSWVKLAVYSNFSKSYEIEIVNLDNIVSIKPKTEKSDTRLVIASTGSVSEAKDSTKKFYNLTELRISDDSATNLEVYLELKEPIADLTESNGQAPKSHAPWG